MASKAASAAGSKASSLPPNQTLYITNLPSSKIQKYDLRLSLYILFSTYGPVLDVVALRTTKMRGQAHVVFRDVQTATQAMRSLQGFEFFGKEMQIAYAKSKSDTIAKLDGTYRLASGAERTVATTQLQQSIFNAPPSAASLPPPPASLPAPLSLKPPTTADQTMEDARSPASVAGMKRRRDEEEEDEDEESDEDVAMEEDSDDE